MRMRDVAERLGVSAMTISRALRADSSVAPATREAILKAIAELGYVPDQIAGSLASRRSGFAAILVPSLNNSHFSETVHALREGLAPEGLQLLIGDTDYDRDRETSLLPTFLARKPEAIILTSDGHHPSVEKMLARAKIPVVEIWDQPARPIQHVVGFSNEKAMRDLIEALLNSGYQRITYLGEQEDDETRAAARRRGYIAAMTARGLTPRLCAVGKPPATMSEGERGLDIVLQAFPDTELIACVSDPLAFGVMSTCQRRGISVPHELAISGFGNFEISRVALPRITTLVVDAGEIGRATADVILSARQANNSSPGSSSASNEIKMSEAIQRLVPFRPELRESAPGRF